MTDSLNDLNSILHATREGLRSHHAQGFVHLKDLPKNFAYLEFLEELGVILPQYGGRRLWQVKANKSYPGYDSRNSGALNPHTDAYEYPGQAPRYVALWCLHAPRCGGGKTQISDAYSFWETLDKATQSYLLKTPYLYYSTENLRQEGIAWQACHPFCEPITNHLIMRVSLNQVETREDEILLAVHQQLRLHFEQHRLDLTWDDGDLLIWDNWRWMHSRTSFTDLNRELVRVWYHDLK